MRQIISFLLRNKNFLLYVFLFILSLAFTIQSHSYHRSKFINSANFLSGGVYEGTSAIQDYFRLKSRNKILAEENVRLRKLLQNTPKRSPAITNISNLDTTFSYIPAKVLKNSYTKTDNVITIKLGERDSIFSDMGVISSKGIVGIINNTSTRYSTILSILNSTFQTSAKLKRSNHFGTLRWDSKDPNIVQLYDIQEQALVSIGDTIETSGRSVIFPEGINIGTVEKKELDPSNNFHILSIRLINDMTDLGHVYVIQNKDRKEIEQLENKVFNE